MAAGLEVFTRGAKAAYNERSLVLMNGKQGIDQLLFPTLDADTSSSFLLDRYISSPYGVVYRNLDNQSVIRKFRNGEGQLIKPPIASEKTPIDEELSDVVVSGQEPTASQVDQMEAMLGRVAGDHVEAHNMTKWKQALDVVRQSEFEANGKNGADLGLSISYTRATGNSLTYDFTAGGATMVEALNNAQTQLRDNNMPMSRNIVIMGKNWLDNFATDSDIIEIRKANNENVIVSAQMEAPELLNTHGLVLHSILRGANMVAPMWICSFSPGSQYVAYEDATAAPWVPDNDAIFCSLDDRRWKVTRGMKAYTDGGRVQRVTGDVVVDSYSDEDPITEFIRSQTRHCFIPGNANHTAKSTGTFS